jgi:hypothetical protein
VRIALEIERSTATIRSTFNEDDCMRSLLRSIYLDSQPGELVELDPAGTGLENPYVYDSAARELKAMAAEGLVTIVREETRQDVDRELIDRIAFARVR